VPVIWHPPRRVVECDGAVDDELVELAGRGTVEFDGQR
jgi:uncharacterized OB-fold protein